MVTRKVLAAITVITVAFGAVACGRDDRNATASADASTGASTGEADAGGPISGSITVFAASSLTDSFNAIGEAFQAKHPQASVTFNFAASSALVAQIGEGAPADVFASADEANMQKLADADAIDGAPAVFAHNELQIIVAKGNPKSIRSVKDLTDPNLLVVIAAPQVPIGAYAREVFDNAGITVAPVSFEENVKAVVTKVSSGEADAGIVYATDVKAAAGNAEGVAIADELNVSATYPIALTKAAPNAAAAAAFIDFVTSAEGQTILAGYGFAPK